MFDTIHFQTQRSFKKKHLDWKITVKKDKPLPRDSYPPLDMKIPDSGQIQAIHSPTGVKMYGSDDHETFTSVYVPSLPAMLKGHNAWAPNTQNLVDACLHVLDNLLDQVSCGHSEALFTRVDMALNLNVSYDDVEPGLWFANLPRAKLTRRYYPGESATFFRNGRSGKDGSKTTAKTELQFYHKIKQLESKGIRGIKSEAPIIRVELRLRSEDLNKALGPCGSVSKLILDEGYRCLRNHVLSVAPATAPIVPSNLYEFLAQLSRKHPEEIRLYLRTLKLGYQRKAQNKIASYASTVGGKEIPWCEILPENHLPEQKELHFHPVVWTGQRQYVAEACEKYDIPACHHMS